MQFRSVLAFPAEIQRMKIAPGAAVALSEWSELPKERLASAGTFFSRFVTCWLRFRLDRCRRLRETQPAFREPPQG